MNRVPSGPIRKAVETYLSEGHTWSDICRRLGWMQKENQPESARLQRALGMMSEKDRPADENKKMNYSTAIAIIEAIERAPHEFDL